MAESPSDRPSAGVEHARDATRWIDPPSGWKYGFPKPFEAAPGQTIDDWLLANGYPRYEIDKWAGRGVPCRMWRVTKDESRD